MKKVLDMTNKKVSIVVIIFLILIIKNFTIADDTLY